MIIKFNFEGLNPTNQFYKALLNNLISQITIITDKTELPCDYNKHDYKYSLSINPNSDCFSFKIIFSEKIKLVRNSFYSWEKIKNKHTCPLFFPKIIYLENSLFVQANCSFGTWEINSNNPYELFWHFNEKSKFPLLKYVSNEKLKKIEYNNHFPLQNLALLISPNNGIEISRSKIPFSAIACFTDHCDFDNELNIKLQREFFKKLNIKVTKGFFYYHFSKRNDTASWKNNSDELKKWIQDGHELAYHSLSQSVKPEKDAIDDFKSFESPLSNIETWIDHGFQPYNFAQFKNSKILDSIYCKTINEQNISNLWNYIDSGYATSGVINQLNPKHFTLKKYWKGIKHLTLKNRLRLMLKCIFTNYYTDCNSNKLYKETSKYYKIFIAKKNNKSFKILIRNVFTIFLKLLSIILKWGIIKNKPFKLAENAPFIFKHKINNSTLNIFQTIEMVDFKKALCKSNIELLIEEKGAFIAHTYFSVPLKYHTGRLFKNANTIDNEVAKNFKYLSTKIKGQEIWNPTLSELVIYSEKYSQTILDCTPSGEIFLTNNKELPNRKVTV